MVIYIFLLQVAGYDLEGELGFLVLALNGGWPQLVVPHFLVLGTLDREGSPRELLGVKSVFEFDGAVLA